MTESPEPTTFTSAECLLCGYQTDDTTMLEMWNGYGECVGPDHEEEGLGQKSRWVAADGTIVFVETTGDGDHTHLVVVHEDELRWNVQCSEDGCDQYVTVSKAWSDHTGKQFTRNAPHEVRCVLHPPRRHDVCTVCGGAVTFLPENGGGGHWSHTVQPETDHAILIETNVFVSGSDSADG